jgi:hypothetical protein
MDRARIVAILSGLPAGGRKGTVRKPVLKTDAQMASCFPALAHMRRASTTGERRLELTSSQLPPIF